MLVVAKDAATVYINGMIVSIVSNTVDKMLKRNAVNEELEILAKVGADGTVLAKPLLDMIAKVRSLA